MATKKVKKAAKKNVKRTAKKAVKNVKKAANNQKIDIKTKEEMAAEERALLERTIKLGVDIEMSLKKKVTRKNIQYVNQTTLRVYAVYPSDIIVVPHSTKKKKSLPIDLLNNMRPCGDVGKRILNLLKHGKLHEDIKGKEIMLARGEKEGKSAIFISLVKESRRRSAVSHTDPQVQELFWVYEDLSRELAQIFI